MCGLLGVELTDFFYSENDLLAKFNIKATDLFYKKELVKAERKKLMTHNLKYLINYNRIINDNDYYLWMELNNDKNIIINYNNEKVLSNWLDMIEGDLYNFDSGGNFITSILKFFEKIHWIEIESEKKDLIFDIRLSEKKFKNEIAFMLKYLSKYSNITQIHHHKYSLQS